MRSGWGRVRGVGGAWAALGLVGLLALAMVAPFLYMVWLSLKGDVSALRWPPQSYTGALRALPFDRFFLNSAVVATTTAVAQVVTSAMAAYAFARLHFPGRDRLFLIFLWVLTVPALVLLIPRFLIVNAVGWVDSYLGLISTELVSVWGIFLLREVFRTLPRDLEDVARLDGAGEWTILWRVILPLSKPAIVTLAVFAFVDQWKNFLWPLVVTRSMELRVVEVGIAAFHGLYATNWPYQMAAAVTATLPLLAVFFLAQRYVIRGIQLTGVK